MSGTIGISLLESHNDRIEHLVMIAASGPAELESPPSVVEDLGDTVRAVYGGHERIFPKDGWTEGDEEFVLRCIGNGTRFPSVDLEVYRASLSPLWAGLSIDTAYRLFDPPVRSIDFRGRPVLVMGGTHDANHPRAREQRLTDWLRDRGATADLLYLGDVGIEGNAHMLMLEENSSELAGLIVDWLAASTN
jgi:pimeloyl-ACP methyl ester carboxylesterase